MGRPDSPPNPLVGGNQLFGWTGVIHPVRGCTMRPTGSRATKLFDSENLVDEQGEQDREDQRDDQGEDDAAGGAAKDLDPATGE